MSTTLIKEEEMGKIAKLLKDGRERLERQLAEEEKRFREVRKKIFGVTLYFILGKPLRVSQ